MYISRVYPHRKVLFRQFDPIDQLSQLHQLLSLYGLDIRDTLSRFDVQEIPGRGAAHLSSIKLMQVWSVFAPN